MKQYIVVGIVTILCVFFFTAIIVDLRDRSNEYEAKIYAKGVSDTDRFWLEKYKLDYTKNETAKCSVSRAGSVISSYCVENLEESK